MYIFLSILAIIIALITIILLLPVYIIIKTDQDGEVIIRYKILWLVFGENPNPNHPILKSVKQTIGVTRLEKDGFKKNANSKKELSENVKGSFSIIIGLLKRLLELLKSCTIKTLKIDIVCAESDAAQAAINYGICHAVLSPFLADLHSFMKVKRNAQKINITCDYLKNEGSYDYDIVLYVSVFRVIVAIFKAEFDEAKRLEDQNMQPVKKASVKIDRKKK